jgi:hypothetical protein
MGDAFVTLFGSLLWHRIFQLKSIATDVSSEAAVGRYHLPSRGIVRLCIPDAPPSFAGAQSMAFDRTDSLECEGRSGERAVRN